MAWSFKPSEDQDQMQAYVIRRLLYATLSLFGVSVLIFLAVRIIPGDPVAVMFGEEIGKIRPGDRAAIEAQLGLADPLVVQYGSWLKDIFTGTLGESFWRNDTVLDLIKRRGPLTLEITIFAIIIAWAVGVPAGIVSALQQNTPIDYAARFFSVIFLAIPQFWLAAMIVLVLVLRWGYAHPLGVINIWDDPIKNLELVWGSSVVLGLAVAAYIARMTRSTLLEVIREEYIRTARAKGLKEQVVVLRHAMRNTMLPIVTLSGVLFGFMLGGTVILEKAFNVPGLGLVMVESFINLDYMVVQNLVLLYGAVFVLINLVIDVSYAWLDPRIRYG